MTRLKSTRGFTLIELIVVIVIIGILAAIAAVAYNQFIANANEGSAEASAVKVAESIGATSALANVATNDTTSQPAADASGDIVYTDAAGNTQTVSTIDGVVTAAGNIEYTSGDASAFICLAGSTGVGQVPAVEAAEADCA